MNSAIQSIAIAGRAREEVNCGRCPSWKASCAEFLTRHSALLDEAALGLRPMSRRLDKSAAGDRCNRPVLPHGIAFRGAIEDVAGHESNFILGGAWPRWPSWLQPVRRLRSFLLPAPTASPAASPAPTRAATPRDPEATSVTTPTSDAKIKEAGQPLTPMRADRPIPVR